MVQRNPADLTAPTSPAGPAHTGPAAPRPKHVTFLAGQIDMLTEVRFSDVREERCPKE
jgi:hypothetical protein